jgi:hypothetical protein
MTDEARRTLALLRAGHSFTADTPALLDLAAAGLCTRHTLRSAPADPLYYLAHSCRCGATTIGRSQDEPLCERCATLARTYRANARTRRS